MVNDGIIWLVWYNMMCGIIWLVWYNMICVVLYYWLCGTIRYCSNYIGIAVLFGQCGIIWPECGII